MQISTTSAGSMKKLMNKKSNVRTICNVKGKSGLKSKNWKHILLTVRRAQRLTTNMLTIILQYFAGDVGSSVLMQVSIVRRTYCKDEFEYNTMIQMRNFLEEYNGHHQKLNNARRGWNYILCTDCMGGLLCYRCVHYLTRRSRWGNRFHLSRSTR